MGDVIISTDSPLEDKILAYYNFLQGEIKLKFADNETIEAEKELYQAGWGVALMVACCNLEAWFPELNFGKGEPN